MAERVQPTTCLPDCDSPIPGDGELGVSIEIGDEAATPEAECLVPNVGTTRARLLTRFGAVVYMFFMITPPIATVERAWKRGLEFGRYKAVDDLLDHNVEAYTGMPRLFFTWALRRDKQVHYEFLDNSVPAGERPRTVAFGWNDEMSILDLGSLLDVERFRKIDTAARCPAEVHPDPAALASEAKRNAKRVPGYSLHLMRA